MSGTSLAWIPKERMLRTMFQDLCATSKRSRTAGVSRPQCKSARRLFNRCHSIAGLQQIIRDGVGVESQRGEHVIDVFQSVR